MLEGFEAAEVQTGETSIFVRRSGSGPPILLLHGFPQTHLMWRSVAPLLARRFTVICADLRGYGRSGCPASAPDHAPYTKRAMGRDMVTVMERLGLPRFAVAGHDRGGRVAYRLALDHPERRTPPAPRGQRPRGKSPSRRAHHPRPRRVPRPRALGEWFGLSQQRPRPEGQGESRIGRFHTSPVGRMSSTAIRGAARSRSRACHLRRVPSRGDPRP
jgi:pimeloyl-ACP methyl ester carboxylesterase